MFDIENEGEGHMVQYPQCHSMANITLGKRNMTHSCDISLNVSEVLTFEVCYLENIGQGYMEYNIRNGPIRWQISPSIKVIVEHFSLALTVFEIFTFQNFRP